MKKPPIQLFKPYVSPEAIQAVTDVLRSGWIGQGPKVEEFEASFAKYVGAKHAIAVNSATAALHLALVAAGVGEGDEVLTTSLTFVSTNEVILHQQATPVFVDVDDSTLSIDLEKAEKLVSPRTKAIMVVHYGGNPADIFAVYAFASRHKLKVIEDAAHACGASFGSHKIGAFGTTCFSFHAVKNLPAGDGGMITTNDDEEAAHYRRLRWLGIDKTTFARTTGGYSWQYDVPHLGFKCHMNDINAAIGIEHLKRLDEWNDRRRQIARHYREHIDARFVKHTDGAVSANHLCAIRVPDRDAVILRLREVGIEAGVHYAPNHRYKAFSAAKVGDMSVTDRAYSELLSLPLHLLLTDEDVDTVCRELNSILGGR